MSLFANDQKTAFDSIGAQRVNLIGLVLLFLPRT